MTLRAFRHRLSRLGEVAYFWAELAGIRFVRSRLPRGVVRWLFGLPLVLYRIGLGRVVGRRVLLLETRGRKTGRSHSVALGYRYEPETDTYYVVSAREGRTDWYRNLETSPEVRVRVGRRSFDTIADLLSLESRVSMQHRYFRQNPFAARTVELETGLRYDGSEEGMRQIAARYRAASLKETRGRGGPTGPREAV